MAATLSGLAGLPDPKEGLVNGRIRSAARVLATVAVVTAATLLAPVASASGGERRSYIVVFEDRVANPAKVAREQSERRDATLKFVYREALKGYAAVMTAEQATKLSQTRRVAYVEADGFVTASATQLNPPWGLDRIDQRALPLSASYSYANTGSGVTAYVIDTGIRLSHSDFGGRAKSGFDAIDGGSADDCDGHGTHVAGTIGGTTHGVAKSASLVAVRVLDCAGSGTYSQVIAGVDWVTGDHDAGEAAVANMSLGGPASSSLDAAVRNSIIDGVSYAIAAGNDSNDACRYSPARVTEAMTISATDKRDNRPSWANVGSCVDWFAPGAGITSTWHTGDTARNTISGTSMATPHTAGVAALYLQSNASASPQQVRDALYTLTTKGIVKRSRTANNHLLYTSL